MTPINIFPPQIFAEASIDSSTSHIRPMVHMFDTSALLVNIRNTVNLTIEALGHNGRWWVSRGRCQNGVKGLTFQSSHLVWSEVSRAEPHHGLTQGGAHFRHGYIHTGKHVQLVA